MTIKQYTFELFKLYKERQFILSELVENGPDYDFCLDTDTTAAKELEVVDKKILDLMNKAKEDENDIYSDFVYDLDMAMEKVLETLKREN